MNIGFIGLGIMGSAMAANLIKAEFNLTVWNRTSTAMELLIAQGAKPAQSPREVASCSDIVCTMMANPDAVRSVRDGAEGIIAGLGAGKGYIDFSTVNADTSCETAQMAREKGAMYLEAPVAGSRKPAEDATLTIMAAGDQELYDTALPILQALGRKLLFLGETGNAAKMKLANNLVMGSALTALAEGIALAQKSGLDPSQLLEVLDSGAVANPMFRLKGPSMIANKDFPAAFPLKHMQKDLRLALQLAEGVGQPLFATASVNELFKKALASGLGDSDFAAITRTVVARD